jgi:hypothetical protein
MSDVDYPAPPFPRTSFLRPISSWAAMIEETKKTGVIFDEFWYSSVLEGVAYFYEWQGTSRATVLVVVDLDEVSYIEARGWCDEPVSEVEMIMIIDEIASVSLLPIRMPKLASKLLH